MKINNINKILNIGIYTLNIAYTAEVDWTRQLSKEYIVLADITLDFGWSPKTLEKKISEDDVYHPKLITFHN